MQKTLLVVPALLLAGCAVSSSERHSDPGDAGVRVPPVEFRTAFEGYRPFADEELQDWRKANEEVRK